MDLPDPVDVLAFGPHPDDVELCAGGWMLRLRDEGRRTAVVDFTRGEGGSRGDVATREREAAEASAIMGLVARENLGLPDTAVRATPEALDQLTAGDARFVASPRVDSLHGVWFELHEELIRLAGSTRSEELAAGRSA